VRILFSQLSVATVEGQQKSMLKFLQVCKFPADVIQFCLQATTHWGAWLDPVSA
jgi:hypothetical protein